MKFNFLFSENGITTDRRAAVVDAGYIPIGKNRDNARTVSNRIKINRLDPATRSLAGKTRRHMQHAIGFSHVVHINSSTAHMECRTVMREGKANHIWPRLLLPRCYHIKRPPHGYRQREILVRYQIFPSTPCAKATARRHFDRQPKPARLRSVGSPW